MFKRHFEAFLIGYFIVLSGVNCITSQ